MIYYLFSILIKIYLFFNVLQKSYYEYKSIFKFIIKKCYVLFLSNAAIIFLFFLKNTYLNYLVIVSLIFQIIYFFKKTKVFLKITRRIVRLFITVIIEIFLLTLFVPYFLIDLLIPLLIIISDIINKPIEFFINDYFIKKAKRKIEKVDAVKIAITGSYGKTSVKNFIANLLKNKYLVKHSPKSYNTPLGIARFINEEEFSYVDFVIYEFGARRCKDIEELRKYYNYDIAIVTGIGKMHIDTFKNQQNIIKEKMSLVDNAKLAILNYENEFIRNYIVNCKVYTYGFDYGEFKAKNIELSIVDSKFDLYINNIYQKSFTIKPLGRGAILNILPAIICCYIYNIDYSFVEEIETVANRLSLRVINDYYILDDAYNSNILGANYALEVLKSHDGKKYIITPGFVEMNLIKEELAKEYGKTISDSVDCAILVKNDFTHLLAKYIIEKEVVFVESFKEGFKRFLNIKENNSILLIENDLLE